MEKFLFETELEGLTPIEQNDLRVMKSLIWVEEAGFSTKKILQEVVCSKFKGFADILVERKLLLKREILDTYIYGLSAYGRRYIGSTRKFDLYRVAPARVSHSLTVQRETLDAIRKEGVIECYFEVSMDWLSGFYDFTENLRADAVWAGVDHEQIIEVELSIKNIKNGEMDRFFEKITCYKSLTIFNDINILKRYLKIANNYFKNGLPKWKKLENTWVLEPYVDDIELYKWGQCNFKMTGQPMSEIINLKSFIEMENYPRQFGNLPKRND